MKIAAIYSHLNGEEWMRFRKPHLWDEIVATIEGVDASAHKTKESKESRKNFKMVYSPTDLNKAFKAELTESGWKSQQVYFYVTADSELARTTVPLSLDEQKRVIEEAGGVAIQTFNQTDFVKDRVAIEVQFGKYSFVAYDLFVKHMAFYTKNEIDCGVEILPMKSMQEDMSSGPSYFEREIYNVVRQGRGVPAVPLIVIGVEP